MSDSTSPSSRALNLSGIERMADLYDRSGMLEVTRAIRRLIVEIRDLQARRAVEGFSVKPENVERIADTIDWPMTVATEETPHDLIAHILRAALAADEEATQ